MWPSSGLKGRDYHIEMEFGVNSSVLCRFEEGGAVIEFSNLITLHSKRGELKVHWHIMACPVGLFKLLYLLLYCTVDSVSWFSARQRFGARAWLIWQ